VRVTKPFQKHTHLKSGAPRFYFLFADHLQITSVNTTPFYRRVNAGVAACSPRRSEGHVGFQRRVRSALALDRSPHARVATIGGRRSTPLHDDEPRTPYRRTITPLRKRRSSTSSRSSRTASGKEALSAADDHGADDHLELVDKTRPNRLCGEFRTVNSDVVLGVGLTPGPAPGSNSRSILVRAGSARVLE